MERSIMDFLQPHCWKESGMESKAKSLNKDVSYMNGPMGDRGGSRNWLFECSPWRETFKYCESSYMVPGV